MSAVIEQAFPNKFDIAGNEKRPRSGAFEVTYTKNGDDTAVLFSKLELNRFPTPEEMVELIKHYEEKGTVLALEPGSSWCNIL
mmetsp:Transcript_8919/g.36837  ORF Transcript_8919/g.36837 Transcript_8919/m.36837 type:complete len:83 (-) Transcript_8919:273-521(-)|eukprot:CAMPEP_0114603680 /NCGR_PEP_ID=MMETSP0168-20121206/155_1 /TAXON_ID=95228 ORGANISM="Vannella sp., Strain DIVA3 517/6/12" /NCGR_SAMPLE_ID=MMETSP0168 /ASSEMBLY_ACC=CAM_ASM_000044 /LENGTH=82 /DNA_ID=CAMNT_0001814489 /DNA_START=155 /DNA_END=403 /DNA_ORIENTATION=+